MLIFSIKSVNLFKFVLDQIIRGKVELESEFVSSWSNMEMEINEQLNYTRIDYLREFNF